MCVTTGSTPRLYALAFPSSCTLSMYAFAVHLGVAHRVFSDAPLYWLFSVKYSYCTIMPAHDQPHFDGLDIDPL